MEFLKETFRLDIVNELSQTDPEQLVKDSEHLYHKQIRTIVNEIVLNGQYKVILLAGPSSSGKTTSSNLIRENLSEHGYESIVVSMDDFFLSREKTPRLPNGDYDYENYTALDLEYLNKFIDDLYETGTALMPQYNFVTGEREKEYKKIELNENTIVIIEGIHALNPLVFKNHTDSMYRIYICVNTNFDDEQHNTIIPAQKLRLMRRLIRDVRTRGMALSGTFKMWPNVLAGEDLYIKPYKNTADALINSTHAYEPCMYAKTLLPLLEKENCCELSQTLIDMLKHCENLNSNLLPDDSLIHEFLG